MTKWWIFEEISHIAKMRSPKTKVFWTLLFQWIRFGYTDIDTWSVDFYAEKKIYPVLKRYMEIAPEVIVVEPKEMETINRILKNMKQNIDTDGGWACCDESDDTWELFGTHMRGFWW